MTERRSRLPVEPLSDPRWNRIREEVFAELDTGADQKDTAPARSPASPMRYVAVAAACLLTAVAVLFVFGLLHVETPTSLPSRIVTVGEVTLATVGDVALEVATESELTIAGTEATGYTVLLERGRVACSVPDRRTRSPFRVQAGDVSVEVVGTAFSVWRMSEVVRVSVTRGIVRVTYRDQTTLLRDGDEWERAGHLIQQPERISPPTSDASSPELNERVKQLPAPASSADELRPRASSDREPAQPPSARDRYEAASRYESTDPDRAIAMYLQLARDSNAWAANALYAAARLEVERGRHHHGRRLLEQYLRRFPRGQNAEDARHLLSRTQ